MGKARCDTAAVEVRNPHIPHSISLRDQLLLAVEPGHQFYSVSFDAPSPFGVRVWKRTAGVAGSFCEMEDSALQAHRIFRHERFPGELLYLHRDALHTVKASQAETANDRLITLICRI